jgi:succinyl-diaminopimelate desuccinylase
MIDPLPLAQALLRCPSVTPDDAGAQDILAARLDALGFTVHRLRFGATDNLFAAIGAGRPHFCFGGHTDVVPPGAAWRHPPFGGAVADDVLYGRGACDMKGAIAAFVAAAETVLAGGPVRGRLSLVITGDEEGPGTDGTVKVLEWLAARGELPDFCLVGEPTNPAALGDVIKIGRRGSLNATITIHGIQGHAAYPHLADNPVHRLAALAQALASARLDEGSAWFQPSSLQITSIDTGNPAFNVIPASAAVRLNIRFNDHHSGDGLIAWLRDQAGRHAERFELEAAVGGEPFLTAAEGFPALVADAVAAVTGRRPAMDTGGGTSDARFFARHCAVAEFGLVGATMHKVDEAVPLADLRTLAAIYARVIARVLA